MIVYLNGKFIPGEQASVSVDDRGFLFGDGIYEVVRSYQGRLFALEAHLRRLERSGRALRLPVGAPAALKVAAERLIAENGLTSGEATVYLQITRGPAPRKHAFPPEGTRPTVYMAATPLAPRSELSEKGMGVILVPDLRWARCDIKAVALVANVLARQQAVEAGAEEAIFVRDGVALEGAASNFFAVFGGEVVTAPRMNYILAGITREVALELCARLGVPYREAPIFEDQLDEAEELFVTGTTLEIAPVVRLNGRPVGRGVPGPVTRRLQQGFRELVSTLVGG